MSTPTESDTLRAHIVQAKKNPEHKEQLQQQLETRVARLQNTLDTLRGHLAELKRKN